jgi:hypothetical protein
LAPKFSDEPLSAEATSPEPSEQRVPTRFDHQREPRVPWISGDGLPADAFRRERPEESQPALENLENCTRLFSGSGFRPQSLEHFEEFGFPRRIQPGRKAFDYLFLIVFHSLSLPLGTPRRVSARLGAYECECNSSD